MITITTSGPQASGKTRIIDELEVLFNTKLKMTYMLEMYSTKDAIKRSRPNVLIIEKQTKEPKKKK